MGTLVLNGATSGSTTIAPTDAATVTATLPGATGTIMVSGNMPAFSAYAGSTQVVSAGTFTKLQINTKEFDTATCYDATTNYRFTPNVAGYYQVTGGVNAGAFSSSYFLCAIYKNGSAYKQGSNFPTSASGGPGSIVSGLVYFNGSTDYIEFYALAQNSFTTSAGTNNTFFQAVMVRAS